MNLGSNYPNPFRNQTSIDYSIKETGRVRIGIYNLHGQLVSTLVDKVHIPGNYTVTWDGSRDDGESLDNGFFIYRMSMGGQMVSERMIKLK
jgi:flagellar hook assembly protein FlgD